MKSPPFKSDCHMIQSNSVAFNG